MAELKIKRHPIRAALYGLMLGFSIWYFLQFQFAMFSLDSTGGVITKAIIVIVATMALSVAWAYVAPPRKANGPAPATEAPAPVVEAPAAAAPAAAQGTTPDLPSDDE